MRAEDGAPVMVRVAGLPLESVQAFASALCERVEARAALDAPLQAARTALEDRLHAAVPGADPELRRFLLAVKRDCHNGRAIHPRAADPRWAALRQAAGPAADEVARLDAQAQALDAAFEAEFQAELLRQRADLLRPLERADFARGLALASPDLSDGIRALRTTPPAEWGRRERKAEAGLLRYVARAATKVSPFSTFAAVGMGTLRRGAGAVRLRGEPWRATSLVRAKRYLVHRTAELLCRYAPFRDGLRVEMNDSLLETEPERFLYLRPHRWEVNTAANTLRYHKDSLAQVRLRGALVARLSVLLAGERPTYAALIETLAAEFPASGAEGVRTQVDRLVDAGVLQLLMPWPAYEPHLEKRLLQHLRSLPEDPALAPLLDRLGEMVALEDGFAEAAEPAASIRALRRVLDEVDAAATPLAGLDASSILPATTAFNVYEDVWVRPEAGGAGLKDASVADVPAEPAEEALRSAELLVRLSILRDHRHDWLRTLAVEAAERWPGRERVPALQVLHELQPLWQDYMKVHLAHWTERGGGIRSWNPRGLPELDALHRARVAVTEGLPGCVRPAGPGQVRVDAEAMRALLDAAPAAFTDARAWGGMLMMRPATPDASLWVFNRLKEGTGRYGSRYAPVMDPALREAWTSHLAARGAWALDGEPVELLDVHCVAGDTLNVHHPQTPRVLTMPDDEAELPAHRRLRLRDLEIAFGAEDGVPRVVDRGGQRYLPVNLGIAFEAYMPTLLKFLCVFGPSELGTILPSAARRMEDGVGVTDRMVLGNLVVHRRTWTLPAAALAPLREGTDAQAFAAANRLRAAHGIPERVFCWDRMSHGVFHTVLKPQYLDWTSPLFLPLLRRAAEGGEALKVAEVLPDAAACPLDAAGQRRAVEVLVDSLALRRPHARAPRHGERARTGRTLPAHGGGRLIPL